MNAPAGRVQQVSTASIKKRIAFLAAGTLFLVFAAAAGAQESQIHFTPSEQAWLTAHPKIVIGTVPDWDPICMRNKSGDLSGMADSYKNLIELKLPITFELAPEVPWGAVLDNARDKKIDAVMLVGQTAARDKYLLFTDVLVDIPYVIITRADAASVKGMDRLAGKRVSVRNRFVSHEWIAANHPAIVLFPKETTEQALEAVLAGEVDAFVGSMAEAGAAITKAGLGNLKVAANASFTNHLRIGVRNDWPELVSILNKAIAGISPGEHNGIWNLWVHLRKEGVDTRIVYGLVGGFVFIIIAGSIIYAVYLRKSRLKLNEMGRKMDHNLHTYQIELEMQNEELRKTQETLEASRAKYFDLYNFSPVGYFTVSEEGLILEGNLVAANLLGTAKNYMVGQKFTRFILSDDQDIYYLFRKKLFETGNPQTCEVRMARPDGGLLWARLETKVAADSESGARVCHTVMRDVSEWKKADDLLRASEKKYRMLAETLQDGIVGADKDAVITYANGSVAAMLGYENSGEIIGKSFLNFIDGEGGEHARQLKEGVFNLSRHEHQFTTRSGGLIYAIVSATRFMDDEGTYAGAVMAITDITERKNAEAELKRVNRMLTMLSQCNKLLVKEGMNEETLLQAVCLIILEMGGYALAQVAERIPTLNTFEIAPRITTARDPAAKPFLTPDMTADCPCNRAILNNETIIIRNIAQCTENDLWCNATLKSGCNTVIVLPLRFSGSADAALSIYAEDVGSFTDSEVELLKELAEDLSLGVRTIRDREKKEMTERLLRESRDNLGKVMENSPVAMALTDKEQRIVFLNAKFIKIFGYDLTDIPTVEEWWPRAYPDPSYREEVKADWNRRVDAVMREGADFGSMESVVVCKDGNRRTITFSFSFIGTRGLTVFHDITERKSLETKLMESQKMLSNAQTLAHVGNWEMDLQTGKGIWSDESYRIFGFEPGAFEPAFEIFEKLIHPDDRKAVEQYLQGILSGKLSQTDFDMRIIRPDGQERFIHDKLEVITGEDGKPVKIIGVNFDITERRIYERKLEIANQELTAALEQVRQTQAVLMRSEKLAAVGTLSAGVAHEILNPLNIISTICQLLLMDERRGRVHDNLEEVMLQIQRAAKITNNLRMFAREKKFDITPVDLQKLFDHTAGLMEHDLHLDNIFINRRYDSNAPIIMADADQLAQVFMNLLTNARDILQPRRGGMITAATKAVENGVEFKFSDNGPGIPEDVVGRIFDPFFTTKEPGKGTGLGLSIIHNIIEGHGGTISVESREGEGTCFTIFLPKEGGPLIQAKKPDRI